MADDKRDGDDLFEDLDKFFAPIRDVDWESEEPRPAEAPPREEHVAVHVPEAADEPETVGAEPVPSAIVEADGDDDDEEDWYDTSVLEPIDELLGEPVDQDAAGIEPVVSDQAGLFESEPRSDHDDAADLDEELAPSAEEVEAAAEHFAGSVPADDAFGEDEAEDVGPAVVTIDEEDAPQPSNDDLFSDIHGGEVEQDILADLDEDPDALNTVVVGGSGEGLGGPSWQEPTSVEVGADLDRRGPNEGERDVPAAVLTGLVLAGFALGSLLIGPGWFAIVVGIVVLVAQGELFGGLVKHHQQPATAIGLVTGVLMIAGAHYHGESAVLAMFALGVVATFLWFMAAPAAHRQGTIMHMGATLLNVAYIPLLASYIVVMLGVGGTDGKQLVVAVIGLTFIFDTSAFLVGSVWGGSFFQRPLAPTISPKKSIEGLIGASLVTIIVSMALVPSFVTLFEHKRVESLVLAIVVAAAATLGDLAESLIKRDLGIKDMGSILPGHGGILDRIDSLLFVAPAAFLLFRLIFA